MIEIKNAVQAKSWSQSSALAFISSSFLAILLVTAGCTGGGSQQKISIQLPSTSKVVGNNSLSVSTVLTHMRVQIYQVGSTDSTDAQTFSWDQTDSAPTAPPATFSVPASTQLVIQVLAGYQDPNVSDGTLYFSYGDSTQAVSAAGDVTVQLADLNPNATTNGTIAGRYVRLTGAGPTGRVRVEYPVANKRPIFLTNQEIFGGWFRFFSIQGVPLNYTMALTGESIFANASVDSASLIAVDDTTTSSFNEANRTALINMPSYYSTNNSPYKLQSAQSILFGYFGAGAGQQSACYPAAGLNLAQTATTLNPLTANSLTWVGNSTATSTQASVSGGTSGTTACNTTANQFVDHVLLNASNLASRDQFLGYSGPFVLSTSSNSSLNSSAIQLSSYAVSSGLGTAVLRWTMLPNISSSVAAGGIDGVTVFKRDGTAISNSGKADYQIDDGYACSKMADKGFTAVAGSSVSLNASTLSGTATITNINALNYQAGKFQAVVCPYRVIAGVTTYFNSAADYRAYSSSGGVTYKIKLASGSADTAAAGTCTAYKVYSYDSSGNQTVAAANVSLDLASALATGFAYTTNSCTTSNSVTSSTAGSGYVGATVSQVAGAEASSIFYVKLNDPQKLFVSVAVGSASVSYDSINIRSSSPAATYGLQFNDGSSFLVVGMCYPLYFGFSISGATSLSIPAVQTTDMQFTLSGSAGGQFFSDARCANSLTQPFVVSAGFAGLQMYFSPSYSGTLSFGLSPASSNSVTLSAANNLNGTVNPASPIGYAASVSSSGQTSSGVFAPGQCTALQVRPTNSNGDSVYAQAYSVLPLTSSNATLYADATCATPSSNLVFLTGSGTSTIYFKANSGATTLSFVGSDGAGHSVQTNSFLVAAPTHVMLTYLGSPINNMMTNACYPLSAQMYDASPNLFTSSNSYSIALSIGNGGSVGAGIVAYSDVNCTTSVASIPVPANSSAAQFYAKFTSPAGGVSNAAYALTSSLASGVVASTLSSTFVLSDADHIQVTYARNPGTGTGTLYFQMLGQGNTAPIGNIAATAVSFALTGGYTANSVSSTSLSIGSSGNASIALSNGGSGGGTVSTSVNASSLWKGAISNPALPLAY